MTESIHTILRNSFGFVPEESTHHFLVNIQRSADSKIEISEHFTWDEQSGSSEVTFSDRQDGQVRVILSRLKWDAIADELRAKFNQRLKKMGQKTGNWRVGHNIVRLSLGKELVLLCWAIEDADPTLIPTAISNWKGLVPEERWWLYTQTAAATGHGSGDRGIGWRKAIRFALTENPITAHAQTGSVVPEYFRRANSGPLFNNFQDTGIEEDIENDFGE